MVIKWLMINGDSWWLMVTNGDQWWLMVINCICSYRECEEKENNL